MDLDSWLSDQQLGHLAPLLRQGGIDLDVVNELDDADLVAIGLNLGDRKRLLKAIKASLIETSVKVSTAPDSPGGAQAGVVERRHLTVMFCDIVGSTELAKRLDPEDLRQVVGDYQQAVAAAVAPYDGYIAQFLGDGALVYFGYPKAHEDDGDRAVRAAISVLDLVNRLRPRLSMVVRARIGIASGLVVVGQIGVGTSAAENSASGETPSLAARLQSHAGPGEIVVSRETRLLLGSSFEMEESEPLILKGFGDAQRAWRVVRERSKASRFEERHTKDFSELIGRDSEVLLLLDRWLMARDGEGQVVLISGEAGIGKSRISQVLRDRISDESFTTILWQCSPYFTSGSLYPVVRELERASKIVAADSVTAKAEKLREVLAKFGVPLASAAYLLKLVGLPVDKQWSFQQTAEQVKTNTLNAIIDCMQCVAQSVPLLLLVEDAHWIDPTTEETLALAIERLRQAQVMILITGRPEYLPGWLNPAQSTRLVLGRLGQRQSARLIDSVIRGKSLPHEVLAQIVKKTDGIPLFIEELTKTVVESGLLEETLDGYELTGPLPTLSIPSTLADSLMARLDRLAPAKEVAQVAAVIGRDFERELLREVLGMPDAQLASALDELVRAQLVFNRGAIYTFRHALIRDTAYSSMLRAQRALRHAQVASAIERIQPELVVTQPELLAQHQQEAGHTEQAIRYWTAAGDRAWSQSGARESSFLYLNALKMVAALPEELPRGELELSLHLKRGHALAVTEGYASPATVESFEKARELARDLGRIEDFIDAWAGSAPTLFGIGRPSEAIAKMNEVGPIQMELLEPRFRITTAMVLGVAHHLMGNLIEAWRLLEEARLLDDAAKLTHHRPAGGGDPAVVVRLYAARTRSMQGYLEQGEAIADEAMSIAQSRGHVPTIAWAKQIRLGMLLLRGNFAQAALEAQQSLEICEQLGFKTRIATGYLRLGQSRVNLGDCDAGIALIRRGYDLWASVGGKFHLTEYGAQAAHDLLRAGQHEAAAQFVAKAQEVQATTDERHYAAELLRLSGELLRFGGDIVGAEVEFRKALQVADEGSIKLFSLRAAFSLACLLRSQSRKAEARAMLEPVLGWFTEGFAYPDVLEAQAIVETLQ